MLSHCFPAWVERSAYPSFSIRERRKSVELSIKRQAIEWIATRVMALGGEAALHGEFIQGGLTPYLQAGDVGIFKSSKDRKSVLVDEWMSDQVTYTLGGNPRLPSIETVASWVSSAWRQALDSVVKTSEDKGGSLDNPKQWHIKHDGSDVSKDDAVSSNELLDAFDEVWIEE